MLPVVSLGPLSLPVPGLVLILGVVLGSWLAERWAPHLGVAGKWIADVVFYSLLAGLIGARLFMILRAPNAFARAPLSVFSLNPALLDPIGGVLTAVATAGWLAYRRQISWLRLADALVPFLATLQLAFALRVAASGEMFGLPTDLPWGVELWGAVRHPTQLYWALGAAALLALLQEWVRGASTTAQPRPAGWLFWRFLALSAAWFVFVAGFRGDSPVTPSGWRVDQGAALLVLAVALFQWRRQTQAMTAASA